MDFHKLKHLLTEKPKIQSYEKSKIYFAILHFSNTNSIAIGSCASTYHGVTKKLYNNDSPNSTNGY